jgi:fatty-acid desaturase
MACSIAAFQGIKLTEWNAGHRLHHQYVKQAMCFAKFAEQARLYL